MTSVELAEFVARSRRLFRGEMDEDLFALAKARIAGLKFAVCISALEEYALMHGGARARFIPAKFFEFFARLDATVVERRIKSAHIAEVVALDERADLERAQIDRDWRARRRECESISSSDRAEIVRWLRSVGWPAPSPEVSGWSRAWLLAVSDLATDRICTMRMQDGSWSRQVSATEFYAHHAGIPSRIDGEAIGATQPPRSARFSEPLGEAPSAVSAIPASSSGIGGDVDDIPF